MRSQTLTTSPLHASSIEVSFHTDVLHRPKLKLFTLNKRLSKRAAAAIILCFMTVTAFAGIASLVSSVKALPNLFSIGSGPQAANTELKPNGSNGAATTTCTDSTSKPVVEVNTSFASCPSFSLDFATMAPGALSNQYFNIYTGKPEANNEAQYYTGNPQNLRIADGNLVLNALYEPQNGYNYTSARINTKGKEDFLYGKIVVRATMPKGTGTWPALWMLASDEKYKSLNSSANRDLADGEIDIAEAVGTEPNTVYGIAHSVAHPTDGLPDYFSTATAANNDTTYHDYELDWTPTNLTFLVDGKAFFSIDKQPHADYRSWPYDQHYYLILNLALGGSWGGVDRAHFPADGIDRSALPASMKVKSINYYPYVK